MRGSETTDQEGPTGEGDVEWEGMTTEQRRRAGERKRAGKRKVIDWVVYRRGRYDEVGKNFSYLGVRNTELPWKREWDEPVTMPEVDRTEASEEWLEAVGLLD
ncbi:hypothetical protein KC367_g4991 [Hortaea werneckii]|nr:hypothetical protein KC367_g4991 [Hortaea werneckii]